MTGKTLNGRMQHGRTAKSGTRGENIDIPPSEVNTINFRSSHFKCEQMGADDFENLVEVFKMLREQRNKLELEKE